MKFTLTGKATTESASSRGQDKPQAKIVVMFKNEALDPSLHRYQVKAHAGEMGAITWLYGRDEEVDVMLVGLGEAVKLQLQHLRIAAGNAGRAAEKEQCAHVSLHLDALELAAAITESDALQAWVEGWLLGTYTFDQYKSEKKAQHVQEVYITAGSSVENEDALHRGVIRAEGTKLARDLANEPPNILRPSVLVERAAAYFRNEPVEVTIFEEEQLREHQMNGILAVGKGSEHPPALLELRYCTDDSKPLIALVGKGISFDTGGISLKQGRDLSDMRMDMAGAAAVLGAMKIIARSGIAANVTALVATAENMPDGGSMIPGELIEYANGISVQVKNTDAEGRLVLADALIHAVQAGAKQIIDIATLTGACANALGVRMAGVWGTNGMADVLYTLGEHNGEKAWPMPLEEDYEDLLNSDYADLANITDVPYAGAITAALFLQRFVDSTVSWAHLDIAGPMSASATKGYSVAGASGYGARLLADYVTHASQ